MLKNAEMPGRPPDAFLCHNYFKTVHWGLHRQPVGDTRLSLPILASSLDDTKVASSSPIRSHHPSQGSPGNYCTTKLPIIYFKKKQNRSWSQSLKENRGKGLEMCDSWQPGCLSQFPVHAPGQLSLQRGREVDYWSLCCCEDGWLLSGTSSARSDQARYWAK